MSQHQMGSVQMHVSKAVATRRSVRAFLDKPVDPAVIRRLIEQAGRAPSGGNLQPWHIYVVTGAPLAQLKTLMEEKIASHPKGEGSEFNIYPPELEGVYADRRVKIGEAMYNGLAIARDDRAGRRMWFNRNYRFFDAPVGLFCFIERYMGPPQWSDMGMYLQTLMLLLREEGLDSCAQECWALFHNTISTFVQAPDHHMLFCGLAIGYRDPDHAANNFPSERAALEEFATFIG